MTFSSDWLLELAGRATVLCVVAGLLSALLGWGRVSAARRHLVTRFAVLGLLTLPLFSIVVPPVPIHRFAAPASPPSPLVRDARPIAVAPSATETAVVEETPSPSPSSFDWRGLIGIVWAIGVLGVAGRTALGLLAVRGLLRRARPAFDAATDAAARLGLNGATLLRSDDRSPAVPVAVGGKRGFILLPGASAEWPRERLDAALLHEFAHLERRDWEMQIVGRLACALYWFHPLVWRMVRRMRAESEAACDDRVLASGIPAADYAGHLVEIARTLQAIGVPVSSPPELLTLVRPNEIEDRIAAILDRRRSRRGASRRIAVLVAAFALAIAVLVAAVRPTRANRPDMPVQRKGTTVKKDIRTRAAAAAAGVALLAIPAASSPAQTAKPPKPATPPTPAAAAAPKMATPTKPAAAPKADPSRPPSALPADVAPAPAAVPQGRAFAPVPADIAPVDVTRPTLSTGVEPVFEVSANEGRVSARFGDANIRRALQAVFTKAEADFVLDPKVSGTITLQMKGAPLETLLGQMLRAASPPLTYQKEGDVYIIKPRPSRADAVNAESAWGQIQLRFLAASSLVSQLKQTPDFATMQFIVSDRSDRNNVVLVKGTEEQMVNLNRIVAELDRPAGVATGSNKP